MNADTAHAEQIFRAAAALAGEDLNGTFSRSAVRHRLGLGAHEWQYGPSATFQMMRDDLRDGALRVGAPYDRVFHRVSYGKYRLSDHGRHLAVVERTTQRAAPE